NLIAENGPQPLFEFYKAYPQLSSNRYDLDELNLDEALQGAQLVLVHEWNDPGLVERIGEYRHAQKHFLLFFHDTHHRVAAQSTLPFNLNYYDGVLAYGQVLTDKYLRNAWTRRAWTWHEAADVRVFHPLPQIA